MTRAAVAGLGLIGGSLALALRARGFDRDPETRRLARLRGIDTADALAEVLRGADVVFLAVSTEETPALLAEAVALAPGALFSDCASMKGPVLRAAAGLPPGSRFVGGHPMAGSTARGPLAADPELFRGRPWALVPAGTGDNTAIRSVAAVVSSVGARPIVLDAKTHDEAMTRLSHLPHAVAASLARVAGRRGAVEAALAGPGLLDTTRLAGTPIALLLELCQGNPAALAEALGDVAASRRFLRKGISARPGIASRNV
jgi:prephenate dehydrogenase